MSMSTLAVFSLKGGVGKTTIAANLADALNARGRNVLLVDLDPQGNLTESFGYEIHKLKGIEFLMEKDLSFDDVTIKHRPGLDLIPAGKKLKQLELTLSNMVAKSNDSYFYYLLKNALEPQLIHYQYVIVDCPPRSGFLTLNALSFVDQVIVPTQCQFLGYQASKRSISYISRVRRFNNPRLKAFGILPTMYDARSKLSEQMIDRMKTSYNGMLMDTRIRINVALAEAPAFGQTILEYNPYSRGAEDFGRLAGDVIEHFE